MKKRIESLRYIGVDVRINGNSNMIGTFMKTPVMLKVGGGSIASVSQKGRITVSDMFLDLPSHVQEFILLHEIGHKLDNEADWESTPSRSHFVSSGEVSPEELRADDYAREIVGDTRAIKALEDFIEIMESKDVSTEALSEVKMRLMAIKGLDVNPVTEVNPEEEIEMENNTMNNAVTEVNTKGGRNMRIENFVNQPEYRAVAENLPIYSMENKKGTYLNLCSYQGFDIVAIYDGKEVKLWRVPSENFYQSSEVGYEQVVEHRGKEEVMISDNRNLGKFLSHDTGETVGQGLYFGRTEKEFKLKVRSTEYAIFNRQVGYKVSEGLFFFLNRVIEFAKEENLSLKEAAVQWAGTDFHIAKISSEDSYTLNLKTKILTERSVRNGKVTLRRGVHPKSKPVIEFLRTLERNSLLTNSLKGDIETFLLKEMDSSLKEEMSYIKDSYSLEELIVLSRYPNYLWVLESFSLFEDSDFYYFDYSEFYYLKWTSAVRQSKLMKKGEFFKRFMPKLGKKTANRLASSSTIVVPSSEAEDWPYAFMGRLADPKLLMGLAEKIADFKQDDIKSCLYLDNQVHQGLSFLTLERWLNRKGLSERLVFLINKAIQSNRETGWELRELKDSMHILLELYEFYPEAELSELTRYRSIKDFHDALVRLLRYQERQVSQVPYVYSQKAKDLTLKSGQWEIVLPDSEADIVDAGDLLSICVGSSAYTRRHNKDNFYILFLKERGRLMAVIELKDKEVYQFKFKYNNVFHHVQLEDRKELSCFIKGWMENNKLTNQSYDLVGLDDTGSRNNDLQVEAVNDDGLFEWAPRELGPFDDDGDLPF